MNQRTIANFLFQKLATIQPFNGNSSSENQFNLPCSYSFTKTNCALSLYVICIVHYFSTVLTYGHLKTSSWQWNAMKGTELLEPEDSSQVPSIWTNWLELQVWFTCKEPEYTIGILVHVFLQISYIRDDHDWFGHYSNFLKLPRYWESTRHKFELSQSCKWTPWSSTLYAFHVVCFQNSFAILCCRVPQVLGADFKSKLKKIVSAQSTPVVGSMWFAICNTICNCSHWFSRLWSICSVLHVMQPATSIPVTHHCGPEVVKVNNK